MRIVLRRNDITFNQMQELKNILQKYEITCDYYEHVVIGRFSGLVLDGTQIRCNPNDDDGINPSTIPCDTFEKFIQAIHDTHGPEVFKKDTNPKDAVGSRKVPMSVVSGPVLAELGAAMLEGSVKYGRHNYRVAGVRASVYYDATFRHLLQWYEGEDIDPDSGVSHITKAIASLVVLRDSMIKGNMQDDRPPKSASGWLKDTQAIVDDILEKHHNPVPAHTEINYE